MSSFELYMLINSIIFYYHLKLRKSFWPSEIKIEIKMFNNYLCTGGAYYVTYSFRFISNKPWDGGGGEGREAFT